MNFHLEQFPSWLYAIRFIFASINIMINIVFITIIIIAFIVIRVFFFLFLLLLSIRFSPHHPRHIIVAYLLYDIYLCGLICVPIRGCILKMDIFPELQIVENGMFANFSGHYRVQIITTCVHHHLILLFRIWPSFRR